MNSVCFRAIVDLNHYQIALWNRRLEYSKHETKHINEKFAISDHFFVLNITYYI